MNKVFILIVLLNFNSFISLTAQTKKEIIKTARVDVGKQFEISNAEYKKFKKDRTNKTSDLFKPKPTTVSDIALLADSVYVKAYRNFAYRRARTKADSELVIWVGGGFITLIVASLFVLYYGTPS